MKELDLNVLQNGGTTEWEYQKGKCVTIFVHVVNSEDDLPKGRFHFKDAFGNRIYVKTKDRQVAQMFVNKFYGNNKYNLSTSLI